MKGKGLFPFRLLRQWQAVRRLRNLPGNLTVVLGYHNVTEARSVGEDLYAVSHRNFEQHVRAARRWFSPTLCRVIADSDNSVNHRIALTFDDGKQNNYDLAFPILESLQVPATFFVSPGLVGLPGYMDWGAITNLAANGMEIGCHGYFHDDFSELPASEIRTSLQKAKAELEDHLSEDIQSFAFPYGHVPADHSGCQDILSELGFAHAFAFEGNALAGITNPYHVDRHMMVDVTGVTFLENLVDLLSKAAEANPKR